MKSQFEQNGGTYRDVNGYRIPNLTAPDESAHLIGIWGQRRLNYLKYHKRVLYINLLTSGKLKAHLHEIDEAARERREIIIKQMTMAQGVTEQLKAENQLIWVGKVGNIYACADEFIRNELIYD